MRCGCDANPSPNPHLAHTLNLIRLSAGGKRHEPGHTHAKLPRWTLSCVEIRCGNVTAQPATRNPCPALRTVHGLAVNSYRSVTVPGEGVLLNTDGRLKGLSPMNPLPKDSAFNKRLKQKPRPLPAGVPVLKPCKPAQPARFQPFKPAQPVKVVMQKPKSFERV